MKNYFPQFFELDDPQDFVELFLLVQDFELVDLLVEFFALVDVLVNLGALLALALLAEDEEFFISFFFLPNIIKLLSVVAYTLSMSKIAKLIHIITIFDKKQIIPNIKGIIVGYYTIYLLDRDDIIIYRLSAKHD